MVDLSGGQFPSLDGHPEAEVAQRTEVPTEGSWFRKTFTVHNRAHTRGLDPLHESHLTNFGAVLTEAIQRGLHPKDFPELESEEDHPWEKNTTNLTYRVQVVPAVTDTEPQTTVTPAVLAQAVAALPEAEGEGGVPEAPADSPSPAETPEEPVTDGPVEESPAETVSAEPSQEKTE